MDTPIQHRAIHKVDNCVCQARTTVMGRKSERLDTDDDPDGQREEYREADGFIFIPPISISPFLHALMGLSPHNSGFPRTRGLVRTIAAATTGGAMGVVVAVALAATAAATEGAGGAGLADLVAVSTGTGGPAGFTFFADRFATSL